MPPKPLIGVIGASDCSAEQSRAAFEVGKFAGALQVAVVCGGMNGVMEEASRGCVQAGGTVLGILPTGKKADANPFVSYAIPTNLGHARNMILAHAADILVAIGKGYGTLSEIAIALKLGKKVLAFETWEVDGVVSCRTLREIEAHLRDFFAENPPTS